jgi:signal transduction histidine kinase
VNAREPVEAPTRVTAPAPGAAEHAPAGSPAPDRHRGRLFRKYLLLILSLVSVALLASGGISLYFSYQDNQAALASLQHEKAVAAASRIEQFVERISQQLTFAALPQLDASEVDLRRVEFLKLLRQMPEVTDIALLDADGRELNAVSRLGMDVTGSGRDRSGEPAFRHAGRGRPWFGPVYFRKETEPYMTLSLRSGSGDKAPVTVAEVNLKFIWDVVSRIKIGTKGKAYVVDAAGNLVADPDIGLVLRKTSLAGLAHVKAAAGAQSADAPAMVSRDLAGTAVLSSMAPIAALDWKVFVEQPVAEVYAKLDASILRTVLLLLVGLAASALAASALARSMVRPIRAMQEGAARAAAGDLDQRIDVHTNDELEALAGEFNRMAAELKASYVGLERKVDERTAELAEALAHQTATADVLRVIGSSVADTAPVFDKIIESSVKLLPATSISLHMVTPEGLLDLTRIRFTDSSASPEQFENGSDERREALVRSVYPLPLDQTSAASAFRSGDPMEYRDVLADPDAPPSSRAAAQRVGYSFSMLSAPLMWEGRGIGIISVQRASLKGFRESERQLIKTFADQAVIAIQNARLFKDTQEALAQQTAIAELVKAMSRTSFQLEALLHALIENATRLCKADKGFVYLREGEDFVMRVNHGSAPGSVDMQPLRPAAGTLVGRTALLCRPVVIADALTDPSYTWKEAQQRLGFRSMLGVPMLRDGEPVGVIALWRGEVRPFSEHDQRLVTTFADQAVIAIENARLFEQLQAKTGQLEVASRHKSEFLANMSHELRTPLNAIIGFSEVLLEQMFGEVNAKQLEYLHDIHSSGHHLLTLINDVLDLSKIEAGRMELELSTIDVRETLGNALTLVRERASRQGLKLELDLPDELDSWVADARKVKQVLLNLLSNAVKFTPAGGSVTLRARRRGDAMLEIAVIDTGVGIAPAEQARVFDAFRQASGSYLRKTEGTGLGLALARSFVELHGGRLSLESVPGLGSTFSFTLPTHALESS